MNENNQRTINQRTIPSYQIIASSGVAQTDKPWMTLVHGASQDSRIFSSQVLAFQDDYRLLLIDLPGHGKSADIAGPYGLEEYATGVLLAMDDAGIDQTHFWGTHTGASAGLLLATRHVHRFTSLILEGVVLPGVEVASIVKTVGRAKATARAMGIEAARTEWFASADWFAVMRDQPEQCRAEQHWAILKDFTGGPWLDGSATRSVAPILDLASRMTMPVLLINGEHDLDDFVMMANTLSSCLPAAQRAAIPHAGGFPLWEFPSVVNECVRHFLSGCLDNRHDAGQFKLHR